HLSAKLGIPLSLARDIGDADRIRPDFRDRFRVSRRVDGTGGPARSVEHNQADSDQNGEAENENVPGSFESSKLFEHGLIPFRRRADCKGDARTPATLSEILFLNRAEAQIAQIKIQMLFYCPQWIHSAAHHGS